MIVNIGSKIIRIDQIDSTNNYAAEQILTKRPQEGTLFISDRQVGGRGQASNRWESEPYQNLTFSVVLYPDYLPIQEQFLISKAFSLSVVDFLRLHTDRVTIKWPNDIYVGNRKVCGMLIENSIHHDKIGSCIVGIGLNINQMNFVSDAPNPISLKQITGKTLPLDLALTQLCNCMTHRYAAILEDQCDALHHDYLFALYRLGEWHHFADQNTDYIGRILGVDEFGRLVIEDQKGRHSSYNFKEVRYLNTESE